MSAHAIPRLTPEQYLDIERAAESKSEYHDGQMFAMSGGSLPHSRIALRLAAALMRALDESNCTVVNSDLRVQVAPRGPFVYPDITVDGGEAVLADDYGDMLTNPIAIFEVLSPSTEASQTEPRIEVFTRGAEGNEDKWIFSDFVGTAGVCRLAALDCEIPLADIYKGTSFDTV